MRSGNDTLLIHRQAYQLTPITEAEFKRAGFSTLPKAPDTLDLPPSAATGGRVQREGIWLAFEASKEHQTLVADDTTNTDTAAGYFYWVPCQQRTNGC